MTELRGIASAVIRRAERQGYVVPREVRAELAAAGLPEAHWQEVVTLARESLRYRSGRYYYINPLDNRPQPQKKERLAISAAVQELLRQHQAKSAASDRRQEGRADFVQQVQILLDDGRALQVLSRDLSPTGICLIGTRSLLGQKLRVLLPHDGGAPAAFAVRILWTGAVGDGLYENGGMFLEMG